MNIIQIAGILNLEEAEMIIKAGANMLGFPLALDFNLEDISHDHAKEIISKIKTRINCTLITYLSNADEIYKLSLFLNVNYVQLHGEIAITELIKLKQLNPSLNIIKSLVIGKFPIEEIYKKQSEYEPYFDLFITDTYDFVSGASGATGKTHDWSISLELVKRASKPLILAGGLTPENVQEAIKHVRPYGVDCHTGCEDEFGYKSYKKVTEFVRKANSIDN